MGRRQPWLAVCMILGAATALGQNVELTGFIGRQMNGGLDLSTAFFQRMDVQNGRTMVSPQAICGVITTVWNSCGPTTRLIRWLSPAEEDRG